MRILVLWNYHQHFNQCIMMIFVIILMWNLTKVMTFGKSMHSSSTFTSCLDSACHNLKSITTQMTLAVARMKMIILVFWGYHQNHNQCISVQSQMDSKSVKAQITSAVMTLPVMKSSAMNPILLVRCAAMNPIFLGRFAAMNSILLGRRGQFDSKSMILAAMTPAAMTSSVMNPILLGRWAYLGYCMHNVQWEWCYSNFSYTMDWILLQMNPLFLWPIWSGSIKILLIWLSITGNCIKGRRMCNTN